MSGELKELLVDWQRQREDLPWLAQVQNALGGSPPSKLFRQNKEEGK